MTLYLHFVRPKEVTIPVSKEAFIVRKDFDVVVITESGSHVIGSDMTVSRKHARIYYHNGRYYIQDLGSLNGTRINGKPINGWEPRKQSQEVELVKDAVIEVGTQTMFRVGFEESEEREEYDCSMLILLRSYLLEALVKIHEVQQGRGVSLADLRSSLRYIINERTFVKMIENINRGASSIIEQHIDIMETNPHMYQASSELLDGLRETIEGIINDITRKYELCTSLDR